MVLFVYYLVTLNAPFVMPMGCSGFEKRNKWLFVWVEKRSHGRFGVRKRIWLYGLMLRM